MSRGHQISRRSFLEGCVGLSGLIVGVAFRPGRVLAQAAAGVAAGDAPWEPNIWVAIDRNGLTSIVTHRSEMGTGCRTTLPQVVADELGADWERVKIIQAIGDPRYGDQNTDGSKSVRDFYQGMREAGATVRTLLEQAAAKKWGVEASTCRVRDHEVHHESGKTAGFSELLDLAAELPLPDPETLKFRSPEEYRYIGKDTDIYDGHDIVVGKAVFGMDAELPGMKYAAIARPPVLGGTVKSHDEAAALAVNGVEKIVTLPGFKPPHLFQALGGVAVIARDTWSAFKGRKALAATFEAGEHGSYDSRSFQKTLEEAARAEGDTVLERGDTAGALAKAKKKVEADYYFPHLAHASMEPPVAVAHVYDGRVEVWAPTQNPQAAQDALAAALGIEKSACIVHVTLLGGGFGRKSKPDFIVEAALLSREIGAPVKVVWSREDDIQHDYYHTVTAMHMEAGFDENGGVGAWLQRSAFPTIMSTFDASADGPSDMELSLGFTNIPYDIPNLKGEKCKAPHHLRIGWLRAVSNLPHAFGICSFADELAHAAGKDPVAFLEELIGPDRRIDPAKDGGTYGNHGKSLDEFPFETSRLKNVLRLAAEQSGWGKKTAEGEGLGIAVHRSFLSYIATVARVTVSKSGQVAIPQMWMVADVGLVVNPDRVHAQMEGSAVFGASLALYGEITASEGRVDQTNFHNYKMCRINDAPAKIHVHLVESDGPPAGVGEPGVPPVAPAITNAIFAATGKRLRSLPIQNHVLRWG